MAGLPEVVDRFRDAASRGRAQANSIPSDMEFEETLVGELGYEAVVYSSDSIFRSLEADLVCDPRIQIIKVSNEHNGPGIAGGLVLGGKRALLMSQNSAAWNEGDGIFTFLNPRVNDVAVLILMSWRKDLASEPHGEIGRITDSLTRLMAGDDLVFGNKDGKNLLKNLRKANKVVRNRVIKRRHMAILRIPEEAFEVTFEPLPEEISDEEMANMWTRYTKAEERERYIASQKGTFTETNPFPTDKVFDRFEAAQMVVDYYRSHYKTVRFVVSNGFNSRTLLAIYGNDLSFLYLPGYMGGATAAGVGLGIAREDVHVVVLDGNENRQMSAMDKHLKINDQPNVDIVTFDDRRASSTGGSSSLELTTDEFKFSRVIPTKGTNYSRFIKTVARVESSADHTREFAQVLRAIPRIKSEGWTADKILREGIPQT